jgi:hypothetical protein
MGNTSTYAKQQWNARNYTQVKVSLKPEAAAAFKAACAASNETIAGVLSKFMEQYCKTAAPKGGYSPDLSSRRQRRTAVRSLICQLERIRDGEEQYMNNIPDNLQGSSVFDRAEQCISLLNDAIELLEMAY